MNKTMTLGILSVLLIAGIGVASAMPWGPGGRGQCADGECPDALTEEQREEMQAQREEIRNAVLEGDWATYSSLVEEYNMTRGIHGQMTEDAFSTFSQIAQLQSELHELHQQLADELGLEGLGQGQGRRIGMRGMRSMPGMGPGMGPLKGGA